MKLTYTEAQAILNALRPHLTFEDVLDNDAMLNAIRKLKSVQPFFQVLFTVGDSDKIAAIKVVRAVLGYGLREAKDMVDAAWCTSSGAINLGEMTQERFDEARKMIDNDFFIAKHNIRWILE